MFFVGNKKFEKLEYVYEFLKDIIRNFVEGKDLHPKIIVYYNNECLYSSDKPPKLNKNSDGNPVFWISRGRKIDLFGAFLMKYKGLSGTIKYKEEVLWKF